MSQFIGKGDEEWARTIAEHAGIDMDDYDLFIAEMAGALAAQREHCAKVIDAYRERYGGDWPALERIAADIRAQSGRP